LFKAFLHRKSLTSRAPALRSSFVNRTFRLIIVSCLLAVLLPGCTPWRDYIHNGFKVGPNYCKPAAPVAKQWIDANDLRVKSDEQEPCDWWTVFNDPILNDLVCTAYHQSLTLREAGFRILEARAQLGIAIGSFFPQTQNATGSYMAIANSQETASGGRFGQQFFNQWNFGFNLAWELDFWGRFRRAIEENSDLLNASVEDYDGALVTLLGDVATAYANMRTYELRIKYAEDNVKIQKNTLDIVEARFKVSTISELDVDQARTTLEATEAAIADLEIGYRQSIVQLCILMGMPPEDLIKRIGLGPIPVAPKDVAVGIPADLLRRRPDVRAAERRLAAQCAAIGIAESDFYPHISIDGTLGWSAQNLGHLFEPQALNSTVGPTFTWNLLNYGRLLNAVKLQDATFQELLATYQNSVLTANQDVENGLVTFLRGQERTQHQQASVDAAIQAVNIAIKQYQAGTTDFTTVTQVEQIQVQQQDLLAQAEGEIATGLITVYRALGGGWEIRLHGCDDQLPCPDATNTPQQQLETVPAPMPAPQELPKPDAPLSQAALRQSGGATSSATTIAPHVPTFESAIASAQYRPRPVPVQNNLQVANLSEVVQSSPATAPPSDIAPVKYSLNLQPCDSPVAPASIAFLDDSQTTMPVTTRPATSPMMFYSPANSATPPPPAGQR
jgi:NodT family efflux transporter outer membrane factor (OMF) lipoprotein